MRLQVKVNIPLDIRMCLECPFYRTTWLPSGDIIQGTCLAEHYLPNGSGTRFALDSAELRVIPDKCPLLRYEKPTEEPAIKDVMQEVNQEIVDELIEFGRTGCWE